MNTKLLGDWLHKEYPKTCHEADFWRQVKRTVRGEPVGEDQIRRIENTILFHLDLSPHEYLLDLCCGNGALSSRIFDKCAGGLGVDFSEYLIQIARKYFANARQTYLVQDVVDFCSSTADTTRYTKACCYGAFGYLSPVRATRLLSSMRCRFENMQRVFIGNLADRSKWHLFFARCPPRPEVLDDPHSALGYWWDEQAFINLAKRCGWTAEVSRMPSGFYGAHYRFDVTLLPDSTSCG